MSAVQKGSKDLVEILAKAGADPNVMESNTIVSIYYPLILLITFIILFLLSLLLLSLLLNH